MRELLLAVLTIFSVTATPSATVFALQSSPQTEQTSQQKSQLQDKTSRQTGQERVLAFLTKEVRHQLVTLPYYSLFDWLEFEVEAEGTVILRGQTVRPTIKSDAEARVRDIEGVEKVINEIEVLPVSPNDDRLRIAIYRAVFGGNSPLFLYSTQVVPSIHIIVKNGRAVLKGVVDSEFDSRLAFMKANGVSGVFEVKNELRIEKSDAK